MSPSVCPDATRRLNKLDLVFLTLLAVLSGQSYDPHCPKGKLRLKEEEKVLACGQHSHVLWGVAGLKWGVLFSERPGLGAQGCVEREGIRLGATLLDSLGPTHAELNHFIQAPITYEP